MFRTYEVYKLECWQCAREVEIPAGDPKRPETRTCSYCGAALRLEWHPPEAA